MNNWAKRICKANEIDIHYLRTGRNKPPVVLLHGLMLSGACWTPLARVLEKDYDVIMPDARGHGSSSAPSCGYFYPYLAADVATLIDTLDLFSPVLVGHSMGGMTAAVVASQYPQRLRGLVLIDPPFLTPQRQREVHESDVAEQHRKMLSKSREELLSEMEVRHSRRSREIIELFVQARLQTSMHAFDVLIPPNPDYLQLIRTLDVATLLVVGDVGSIVSLEMASELAELNQHVQCIQIKEAGHALPYDQPDRFSAAVQTFLHSLMPLTL